MPAISRSFSAGFLFPSDVIFPLRPTMSSIRYAPFCLLLLLCVAVGCGADDENSVPDASAPAPAGADGLSQAELDAMQRADEAAGQ